MYITATVAVATGAPRDPLRHRVTSPIPVTSRGRPGARRACQSAGAMNTARRPPTHQSVPATRVQDAAAARRRGLCGRPSVRSSSQRRPFLATPAHPGVAAASTSHYAHQKRRRRAVMGHSPNNETIQFDSTPETIRLASTKRLNS